MGRPSDPANSETPSDASGKLRDPSGITLLVVDGPHDGLALSGAASGVTFGRGPGNDVELPLDTGISGEHCSVRYSDSARCWVVTEDRGRASTNGTWFDGRRVTDPEELSQGDEFVIGATVVRCLGPDGAESYLPDPQQIERGTRELLLRLDSTAAMGFGAATALAIREGSRALTDRHALLGLASVNGTSPVVSHGSGLITTEFLTRRVQPNEYWTGSRLWISHLVHADTSKKVLFADQLTATPRLYRALAVAQRQADTFGNEEITSNDVLYGLFSDTTSRVYEWFQTERGNFKRLTSELTRQKTGVTKRRSGPTVIQREPTDSHVAPKPTLQRVVADPIVLDLAGTALRTATQYRLAAAEDRRRAVRESITQVISSVSADRRPVILKQLRECFPVVQSEPADSGDSRRYRERIQELELALETPGQGAPAAAEAIPWPEVLSVEREPRFDRLVPQDAVAVEFLHDLVGFGLSIERFIIGFVAGLMQKGSMSGRLSLPGYKTTIRRTLNLVSSSQSPPEDFKPYLAALETWLVATIAAYHSAPEDWFADYWKKTGPARVEASVPAKFLNDAKCWNHYKNVVRKISPDLVGDEIHAMVRQQAQEKFKELISMRREQ